jgi:heme/copper-type cytochrome/quinol oxidase subunit 1
MNIKKIKVYHLFWIVAFIILFIGICTSEQTLDINIHDTYFVIANLHVSIVLFFFYLFNGFGYWSFQKILKKQLVKSLTIIHSTILIGSFVIYWVAFFYGRLFLQNPEFPYFFDSRQLVNIILAYEFILITFVGLPIYIINLLIGLFRKSYIS